MESHGTPGEIMLTREMVGLIEGAFVCEPHARIEVKGKGPVDTWFLRGPR